jgi:hypothetical protein
LSKISIKKSYWIEFSRQAATDAPSSWGSMAPTRPAES